MEISIKTTALLLAIFLTGLSAGLFYAWQVSVIPGTKRIMDSSYLEAMQSINRAILNPAFYLVFFGSLVMLIISAIQEYQASSGLAFWLLLIAVLAYFVGTFGVTVFGNVPLNEALDKVPLSGLSIAELEETRQSYEGRWNLLHTIRTIFSVLAFAAVILSGFLSRAIPE